MPDDVPTPLEVGGPGAGGSPPLGIGFCPAAPIDTKTVAPFGQLEKGRRRPRTPAFFATIRGGVGAGRPRRRRPAG